MIQLLTCRSVQRIFVGGKKSTEPKKKSIRVAAYCRVSTEMESQQTSLENQMNVFRKRIEEHPDWKLCDIYADDGLSGTQIAHRSEFIRMLDDCETGKIDYIITKSISRFARNTIDCVDTVRKLSNMGVHVYFEKENFDTGTASSEMLLTVLAAFAQEESRSISENLKWSIRKRNEMGIATWTPIYGYRRGENDEWVIQEDEAEIIREIFHDYVNGLTSFDIMKKLKKKTGDAITRRKWTQFGILNILRNEKYVGDALLQKFYCTSYLTHKSVRNDNTVVPSYYVRDHHAPIVDRKTFDRVQKIRKLRDKRSGVSCQYPYGDTDLRCPYCHKQLVTRLMRTQGSKQVMVCYGEGGCRNYGVKQQTLSETVLAACRERGDMAVPESVEYGWLDEYVKCIEPTEDERVAVTWKDGKQSQAKMHFRSWQNRPARVIEFYQGYMERLHSGKLRLNNVYTPEERAELKRREEKA